MSDQSNEVENGDTPRRDADDSVVHEYETTGKDGSPAATETTVRFDTVDPRSTEAIVAVEAYFAELDRRFIDGFEAGDAVHAEAPEYESPRGAFVVVRCGDAVAGCGAVQTLDQGVGEIKRMWIHPDHRGQGIASRLLRHLESVVVELGHHVVRLDTNAVLLEAIAMYERAGYRSIDRYNDNPYAERWFEKTLA